MAASSSTKLWKRAFSASGGGGASGMRAGSARVDCAPKIAAEVVSRHSEGAAPVAATENGAEPPSAKAVSANCKVLILDEPTASLTKEEAFHLMSDIKKIKEQGVGIIFVSHRMDEVKFICDCATVLRNGKVVANLEKDEFTE